MLQLLGMNKTLKKETLEFIELNKFKELTAVQNEVLQYTKANKDVVTIARLVLVKHMLI